jgi:SAM-dependent methyltransferase
MNNKSDWFHNWFNEDYIHLYAHRDDTEAQKHVDFLSSELRLLGDERILDLGCGSGRHTFLFGRLGYNVVGIDTSEVLIHEAMKNLDGPSNISFIRKDMRDIGDLGKFNLILNMFTSFGYFEEDEENQKVLHIIHQALSIGGRFFIDYLHAPYVIKHLIPRETLQVRGEEVKITREIEGDLVIKTIEFPGRSYYESVKLYEPEKITEMLKDAGFTIDRLWGNYEGKPFNSSSERLLISTSPQIVI